MSWNIPPPYFTFSIPTVLLPSQIQEAPGRSLPCPATMPVGPAAAPPLALILLTPRDIHTEMHQDTNSTSREIKMVWKISFLTPASLSKPLRALLKQHLHSWMTKQAVRLSATPQTRRLQEGFPGEHPRHRSNCCIRAEEERPISSCCCEDSPVHTSLPFLEERLQKNSFPLLFPLPFTLELGWESGSRWCKTRPPSPLSLHKRQLSRSMENPSRHLLPEDMITEWAIFTVATVATEQVAFCILIFNLLISFLFSP